MRGQQELNAVESEGTMRSRVPVWSNRGFSGIESSGLPDAKAGTGLGVCVCWDGLAMSAKAKELGALVTSFLGIQQG